MAKLKSPNVARFMMFPPCTYVPSNQTNHTAATMSQASMATMIQAAMDLISFQNLVIAIERKRLAAGDAEFFSVM